MTLSIASTMLAALQADACEAAPDEICGIFFGAEGEVSSYQSAKNVAADTERHFEIDPAVLIKAERDARGDGPTILGYFHSHPSGNTEPSSTDAKSAAPDDRIWLILNGKSAAAWKATQNGQIFDRFDPISLECTGA